MHGLCHDSGAHEARIFGSSILVAGAVLYDNLSRFWLRWKAKNPATQGAQRGLPADRANAGAPAGPFALGAQPSSLLGHAISRYPIRARKCKRATCRYPPPSNRVGRSTAAPGTGL